MRAKLLGILLALICFPLANAQDWYDPWLYRNEILIYNSGSPLVDYQVNILLNTSGLVSYPIYELPITVSSTGTALTDYQVNVTITDSTILSHITNGNDIRFFNQSTLNPYDETFGQLNFWVENLSSSKLVAWVKVDSIPASGSKTIYMYYGNPSAASASDLSKTFSYNSFFDGFESGTITSDWTNTSTSQGRIQVTTANAPPFGSYHLTMDDIRADYIFSRNELTTNFTIKAYNITISFYGREWGDENDNCPSSWTGSSNGDCLAVSCNGSTWYKQRNLFLTSAYTRYTSTSETYSLCGQMTDVRVRWQQYDNNPISSDPSIADGIGLDNINITWFGVKPASVEPTVSIGTERISQYVERKMRSDCGDIRFTNSDGTTLLDYWLESGCGTSNTKVWVKVPVIPSGSKTIYMYYGNPSATSASNGTATFDWFDDFSTNTLANYDYIKPGWHPIPIGSPGDCTFSYDSENRRVSVSCGDNDASALSPKTDLLPNMANLNVRVSVNFSSFKDSTSGISLHTRYSSINSNYYIALSNSASESELGKVRGSDYVLDEANRAARVNRVYNIEFQILGSDLRYLIDSVLVASDSDSSISSAGRILIYPSEFDGWVDDVIVRKTASPEPTVSLGSEESSSQGQPPSQSGKTILKPGQTIFTVQSILVSLLQLHGNSRYLNVYWDSSYIVSTGDVGVTCYLNCDPATEDCSSAQQCNYTGQTGRAACTILYPQYKYYEENSVICKFFNPAAPEIPYEPYPGKTFRPVAFNVWFSPVAAVVGQQFNLRVNVKNVGLFEDNYTVTVSSPTPNILLIDPLSVKTSVGPLKGDSYFSTPETGFSYAKLVVLADEPCVCVEVSSAAKPDVAGSYDLDSTGCPAGCVKIKSKMASLPDFGLMGILQIILLAGILALLKF